jgi:hypothetical protein
MNKLIKVGKKTWVVEHKGKHSNPVKFTTAMRICFMVDDLYKENAKVRKPHKWMRKLNNGT